MADSGGLEDDVNNIFMEQQLLSKDKSGVVILPAMYINGVSIRGSLDFPVVFKAICAGYASGITPAVCDVCATCSDTKMCIANGVCGSMNTVHANASGDTPSVCEVYAACGDTKMCTTNGVCGSMNMVYATMGLAFAFCVFCYIQHRRYLSQMQAQVKGIIAEYMPLESDQIQNTAVSEEDGIFLRGEFK